jgi:hypothetical protein
VSGQHEGHEHEGSGAGALWNVLDGLVLAAVVILACMGAEWLVRQIVLSRRARVTVPDDVSALVSEPKA